VFANPSEGTIAMWSCPSINKGSQHAAARFPHEGLVRLTRADAAAVGELHRSAIATSFLSSLGRGSSKHLYKAVLSSPSAFGFAWRGPDGRLLGYIACAQSTSEVYRQSLLRHGAMMVFWLLPRIWHISVLRRLWEIRYPAEIPRELPQAEILSIAVSPEAHGRGIGTRLMGAVLGALQHQGIFDVKVSVWAGNTSAIKFYERCGFELALTRLHHGRPMNIYTIDLQHIKGQ
jgi:ribosomal protein S18 acetylase RimI-like enzyme